MTAERKRKTKAKTAAEEYEELKRKQAQRRIHWQKVAAASRQRKAAAKREAAAQVST